MFSFLRICISSRVAFVSLRVGVKMSSQSTVLSSEELNEVKNNLLSVKKDIESVIIENHLEVVLVLISFGDSPSIHNSEKSSIGCC
jgi:hypothetical protein